MDSVTGHSATERDDAEPATEPLARPAKGHTDEAADVVVPRDGAAAAAHAGERPEAAPSRWRRHAAFLWMLGIAAALRLVTMIGYHPVLWFNDSFHYVTTATRHMVPAPARPSGYSMMLWLLKPLHSLTLVVGVQHLMGLAMGVMVYALLRHRFGVRGWVAVLAAAPVLFDGFEIEVEHLVMSDTLFAFCTVSAVTIALWWRPSIPWGFAVGLLIAAAALTRSVGLALFAVFGVYLLVRRVNWRVLVAAAVAVVAPVLGYMSWFDSANGQFAMTTSTGNFLYVRVMSFADCAKIHPPVAEIPLCTATPPKERPNAQFYLWRRVAPLHRVPDGTFSPRQVALTKDFALRAIKAQPLDYTGAVLTSLGRTFEWRHPVYPDPSTYYMYRFGTEAKPLPSWTKDGAAADARAYGHGLVRTRLVEPLAAFLDGYQRVVFVRGPLLAIMLLMGLAGIAARWRSWGGRALLPWGLAAALIVGPAVTSDFDYRYLLPAIPLACIAAAISMGREPLAGRTATAIARLARALPWRRAGAET